MSATNMVIRGNMLAHHRGGFPYISPTTMRLDVFGGARLTRLTYPGALQQIPGLSRYWRFSEPLGASMARAAAGALDLTHRGGVITGASGGVSGDADGAVRYDGASAYSSATPNSGVDILQEYVFSCIFNIATIGSTGDTKIMFSTTSSPSPCGFQAYTLGQTLAAAVGNGASFIGLLSGGVVNASEWHHMVVSVSGTGATLYLDGVAVGGASYALATPIFSDNGHGEIAGAQRAGTSISTLFGGVLDDVAVHAPRTAGAHVPSFPQIQQLYHAARSGINATDSPLFHVTPQSAAVSVAYRPRFAFLKGL
jgi:hypothetical protein